MSTSKNYLLILEKRGKNTLVIPFVKLIVDKLKLPITRIIWIWGQAKSKKWLTRSTSEIKKCFYLDLKLQKLHKLWIWLFQGPWQRIEDFFKRCSRKWNIYTSYELDNLLLYWWRKGRVTWDWNIFGKFRIGVCKVLTKLVCCGIRVIDFMVVQFKGWRQISLIRLAIH